MFKERRHGRMPMPEASSSTYVQDACKYCEKLLKEELRRNGVKASVSQYNLVHTQFSDREIIHVQFKVSMKDTYPYPMYHDLHETLYSFDEKYDLQKPNDDPYIRYTEVDDIEESTRTQDLFNGYITFGIKPERIAESASKATKIGRNSYMLKARSRRRLNESLSEELSSFADRLDSILFGKGKVYDEDSAYLAEYALNLAGDCLESAARFSESAVMGGYLKSSFSGKCERLSGECLDIANAIGKKYSRDEVSRSAESFVDAVERVFSSVPAITDDKLKISEESYNVCMTLLYMASQCVDSAIVYSDEAVSTGMLPKSMHSKLSTIVSGIGMAQR